MAVDSSGRESSISLADAADDGAVTVVDDAFLDGALPSMPQCASSIPPGRGISNQSTIDSYDSASICSSGGAAPLSHLGFLGGGDGADSDIENCVRRISGRYQLNHHYPYHNRGDGSESVGGYGGSTLLGGVSFSSEPSAGCKQRRVNLLMDQCETVRFPFKKKLILANMSLQIEDLPVMTPGSKGGHDSR